MRHTGRDTGDDVRRLARHLRTLCSAASLLLCVAVCVLWPRSYRSQDFFGWTAITVVGEGAWRDHGWCLASWQGELELTRDRGSAQRQSRNEIDGGRFYRITIPRTGARRVMSSRTSSSIPCHDGRTASSSQSIM